MKRASAWARKADCAVCGAKRSILLCAACERDYRRRKLNNAGDLDLIAWAARRARAAAVKRERAR